MADYSLVKLKRFAIRRQAQILIQRATDGEEHFVAQYLVIDGKVAQRGDLVSRDMLADAEVRLCYGPTSYPGKPSTSPYQAHVPYFATSQQIEAGWLVVADLVRRAVRARKQGTAPEPGVERS